jgi:AcrR family transcriptional regulator
MAGNGDPRALRTRERLVRAYLDLIAAGRPADLTVEELARAAGVNRSSFYSHYASTADLAVAALTDVFAVVASMDAAARAAGGAEVGSAREVSRDSLLEVLRFVADRRQVYGALLEERGHFLRAVEDAFAESALRTLLVDGRAHGDPEITARFIACGAVGVMSWWLDQDESVPVERLAELLADIIPTDFTD